MDEKESPEELWPFDSPLSAPARGAGAAAEASPPNEMVPSEDEAIPAAALPEDTADNL